MIPLQEIDIHTEKNVFFKVHLVAPTESPPFSTEVLFYDSEFSPPFQSTVSFHRQFNTAKDAFTHALSWVKGYAAQHGYAINRINNPCNCEFLLRDDQQAVVNASNIALQVQVNGA